MKKANGFTLAEVLITLGIIGVVAALTIPTLMHNQRNAALKSGFLKANALVNTVVNQLVYEKGITELKNEYCYQNSNACKSGEYAGMNSSQKLLTDMATYLKYNNLKLDYVNDKPEYHIRMYTIIGESNGNISTRSIPSASLQDGSILYTPAPSNAFPHILIDTNGYKGPNKWGYDLFWWKLQGIKAMPMSFDYGDGQNCALTAGYYSGVMCAQYAIVDKCPWDKTKGYWECLP